MSTETNITEESGNAEGNKPGIPALVEGEAGNKYRDSLGRFMSGNGGIAKRYTSRPQLVLAVLEYFERCEQDGDHLTTTGLALSLGFTSRQALMNYAKEPGYEEFFEVVAWA